MIEINKNITLPEIEELYTVLIKEELSDNKVDLQLPKSIDHGDFGVLFSLIQFVSKWVRSDKSGDLHLPVSNEIEYHDYVFQDFAYPSIVLSWEKKIVDLAGNNIRKYLKIHSQEYFQKMEFFKLPKGGTSVPVYCFDHDISKRGYSRIFYDNYRNTLSEDTLDFNLYPAFEKIGISFNRNVFLNAIQPRLEDFAGIIHELFGNTDEHAKTDEYGRNLYPNVRALYLKFHKRKIDSYKETFKNQKGIFNYFDSNFQLNSQGELYLFEISVLDSGPGLAKRYSKKTELNMPLSEEVEIIKECLYEHNTSSVGPKKEVKGLGLARVLKAIDGKGFLRIKSGRVDLFRDMKKHRYKEFNTSSEIELFDFFTNDSSSFREVPETCGSLISIIYPLDYKSI